MDNKQKPEVIKIPISYKQRQVNEKGDFYVPCDISDRWLQFNSRSYITGGRELLECSVMTLDKNKFPYRLFNLTLEREDLQRVLDSVSPVEL